MKEKLLVLDDEALILTSLENLFEDDYEVFTTSDAEMALQLAWEHDIAVILCDERMPGVSGHEFLRGVIEVSRATRVMMSGYADLSALTEAVNVGQIFAYIDKPWEPLKLQASVAAAVAHFKLGQEVDQERALLRALMENIPDLIYFKDRDSRFTRVNQAYAQNLREKDSAVFIGKSDADYFESEDALRWRVQEKEIVKSGRPRIDCLEQLKNPQGDRRWMSTTKVPMFDRNEQVSGIASISRDITDLKNSEEMLWEQNERNRMILETANDAFIAMDPDGAITAWNPQAERTFGWTAAEVMGRHLSDTVVAPAYRDAHGLGMEHFLTTSEGSLLNRLIELVAVHRDGHEFPVEVTVWPVRVKGAYSFNAFARDISERRRAEEARQKTAKLVQLLQSVTVAANRSSNIEHTVQTCLRQICSHTGWPVGHVYLRARNSAVELISAGFWNDGEDSRFTAFHEASARCTLCPATGLSTYSMALGKPRWIVNLAEEEPLSERTRAAVQAGLRSGFRFPVLVEEDIIAVLEFFSLQTAKPDEDFLLAMENIGSQLGQVVIREHAQEDLRRAKSSAESSNRAKSEFLTNMSHEMRTPMNAILGMADLLAETPLHEEQRTYVNIFQKAGANLLDLINDILNLSKVESGHFELEMISFDLGALLERVIEMMNPRARSRGLKLTLEILPSVPLALVGDPNRLRQILVNLLGNALKFTERGSVTLRVEPAAESPGWLRYCVVDTGIGIAPDNAGMIFDRFTQADSSTTRKYGGTGLGLAISKGLAELMGGRITCTSELGKGSTFILTVPFETNQETADLQKPAASVAIALSPAASVPAPTGFRILLADDSEDNVNLIQAYLQNCGFELSLAQNGKIAVEKVMSGRPDLVLMDIQMPVMDGLEATGAIRQWEAKMNLLPTPILALTAHATTEAIKSSLQAGCTEHLTKPIKKSTLIDAISRHLNRKIIVTPPKGIESLIPKYLANVRRDMDEILAAIASKDCTVARRLGHQFKGTGESYGFPEIAKSGAAVELAAIAANESEIRTQILALATYLDRVQVQVQV